MSSNVTDQNYGAATETPASIGVWWVIEALGVQHGERPTLVARGSQKRRFAKLGREFKSKSEAKSVMEIIDAVIDTGVAYTPTTQTDSGDALDTHVHPITTDGGAIAGVQLWRGPRGTTPPPRRPVGTFEFDCTTEKTVQSRELEIGIMKMPAHSDSRTLPQIWPKLSFDEREDYNAFMEELSSGDFNPGQFFASTVEVDIPELDGRRLTYMTVRAVVRDGTPVVFGLVHDISDTKSSMSRSDDRDFRSDNREFTRFTVELAKLPGGIGEVVLRSGYVCEWFRSPPEPLDRWLHAVPIYDAKLQHDFTAALNELLSGSAGLERTLIGTVRFDTEDADEIPVEIELVAVGHNRQTERANQCLIRVLPLTPPAGIW